jgi:hypothetical protein
LCGFGPERTYAQDADGFDRYVGARGAEILRLQRLPEKRAPDRDTDKAVAHGVDLDPVFGLGLALANGQSSAMLKGMRRLASVTVHDAHVKGPGR